MRKSVIASESGSAEQSFEGALDLEQSASVEVTSEDPEFPVDHVFSPSGSGWRAAAPGKQILRLSFDQPASISRVHLEFQEPSVERTQEFTLTAVSAAGQRRELLRQQWNFSPNGSQSETEDIAVTLGALRGLELQIIPNISGGPSIASLRRWIVFA